MSSMFQSFREHFRFGPKKSLEELHPPLPASWTKAREKGVVESPSQPPQPPAVELRRHTDGVMKTLLDFLVSHSSVLAELRTRQLEMDKKLSQILENQAAHSSFLGMGGVVKEPPTDAKRP